MSPFPPHKMGSFRQFVNVTHTLTNAAGVQYEVRGMSSNSDLFGDPILFGDVPILLPATDGRLFPGSLNLTRLEVSIQLSMQSRRTPAAITAAPCLSDGDS